MAQTPRGVYVAKLGGGQVNTATGDFVFGMTEAYLIEDGKITEPLRDANLIGNGPEVLKRIDAVGNDFAMTPGTCGKDGQSVPGRLRPGHHAADRRDHRRDGRVSVPPPRRRRPAAASEPRTWSAWPTGWPAGPGRVRRSRRTWPGATETEVRAYGGEVESLTSATSAGIGIRVVADHRLGFAWAGSLDESVLEETLAEARDNARFATADEHVGLAVPDGVRGRGRRPVGRGSGRRCRPPPRWSWPWRSRPGPGPPTRGSARSTRPTTATCRSESALVSTTGIRVVDPQDVRATSRSG